MSKIDEAIRLLKEVEWEYDGFVDRCHVCQATKIAGHYGKCKHGQTLALLESEPEPIMLYIDTDGMRRDAQSVKYGQGTPAGSMAKMVIDCCDYIDQLNTELAAANNTIQRHDSISSIANAMLEKEINCLTAELKAKDNLLRELLAYAKEGLLIDEHLAAHIEQALKEKL